MRSLDTGATGMMAQQMNVDVISNNIANMTTTGFKRQRIEFADLMYQSYTRPGTASSSGGTTVPSGLQVGLGVRPVATYRIHEQGSVEITNNDFDVSISGKGYFQVQLPNGDTAYTRGGSFQLNQNGEMVTPQGYLLEPTITIPNDALGVEINEEGEVLVSLPQQTSQQNVGQIQLADFVNPSGLEPIGDTMFQETDASGSPTTGNPQADNFGKVIQGTLELSNVDSVKELTSLITAQRAYEMNSNIITTSDEMMNTVNQMR
ncbi:MAG: flagellar basal-body rod protein FlgG [Pseudomonadota bacterium]